jgi:threonine dehydratase
MTAKEVPELATIIISAIGGGGIITAIVAAFKVKPDIARVTVSAAEGAVIVQSGVISSLRDELNRLKADHAECEKRHDEMEERLTREVEQLRAALKAVGERRKEATNPLTGPERAGPLPTGDA